ncbi:MAG: RtcB family protein [Defluviitaleaceae bacterium]|nr:RtcB family protein [Defluviitaleaceae bacterium]
MIEIKGKRNSAIVYASKIDRETKTQLAELLRDVAFADSKIRIMPDTHSGKGCVVGTTMTLNGRLCPALVGVDIGCGMETVVFEESEIDLPKLDELIHSRIPSGARVHGSPLATKNEIDLSKLRCYAKINAERAYRSIGTMGGGNHFIELDRDDGGALYLVIHSGSRQLGSDVAKYYQDAAYKHQCKKARKNIRAASYEKPDGDDVYGVKPIGREKKGPQCVYERAALDGGLFDDYIHDISIVREFADLNRRTMAEIIGGGMGLRVRERFSNVHNYVDTERMILRKGAVSANQGERLIIPLNMRDGALICTGLGNPDWNFSAPHGAGRVCSRTDAKYAYSVEEFREQMKGVYTTTANEGSLDECPMAYKAPDGIISLIGDAVRIEKMIRPVYNFKACN